MACPGRTVGFKEAVDGSHTGIFAVSISEEKFSLKTKKPKLCLVATLFTASATLDHHGNKLSKPMRDSLTNLIVKVN